jgi:hypothetical protein
LRQTYGYAKQGAGRGYTGVKGLNALLAIVSTPSSSPVIAAARLRKGSTNSARGAARFVTNALITARKAGATGTVVLRADSAYYGHDVIAAALRQGVRFSITARQDKAVRKAIASIADDAWTTINYTNAVFDEDSQQWISDADVRSSHLPWRLADHAEEHLEVERHRQHRVRQRLPEPRHATGHARRANHTQIEQRHQRASISGATRSHDPSNVPKITRISSMSGRQPPGGALLGAVDEDAEVIALKGDSYRLKDRDLGRVPAASKNDDN